MALPCVVGVYTIELYDEEADRKDKEKESAEIARRERELAALDAQIVEMRKRLKIS